MIVSVVSCLVASSFAGPLAMPPRSGNTQWVNAFSTQDLMGIAAPPWTTGIAPFSTSSIYDGKLHLSFVDPAPQTYWMPVIQKGWGMNLDKALEYVIEVRLKLTSSTSAPVPVRLVWNDGAADGLDWSATEEAVTFEVVPNSVFQTFRFCTADTTTWPKFSNFGDANIGGFWLELGVQGLVTPSTLYGGTCEIDSISFTQWTGAIEPRVYMSYFPDGTLRDVSGANYNWSLTGDTGNDGTFDVNWSGDIYRSADRKEMSGAFYPRTGLYDSIDVDAAEFAVLIARAAGIDGFLVEVSVPDSHPDAAMHALADLVTDRGWQFQVGLHWANAQYFAWHADKASWGGDRTLAMQTASADYAAWLGELYDKTRNRGVWVGEHPLVLFFDPANASSLSGLAAGFAAADFDALETKSDAEGWTGLKSPWRIARDVNSMSALDGKVNGPFSWSAANGVAPPGGTYEPWTTMQTLAQLLATSPAGYLINAYNQAKAKGSTYQLILGGIARGFDDHKGKAWVSSAAQKRYLEHGGTQAVTSTWDAFLANKDSKTIAFANNWSDWQEGSIFYPTREFGYRQVEALAQRVWTWRGSPSTYSPSLLRLPERLLDVRRGLQSLRKVGYTDAELATPLSAADAAANKIHEFDQAGAEIDLAAAEIALDPLLLGLSRRWVKVEWAHGAGGAQGFSVAWPQAQFLDTVDVGGLKGYAFELIDNPTPAWDDYRIGLKVSDVGLLAELQNPQSHFVGRVAYEWLDSSDDWLTLLTDAPADPFVDGNEDTTAEFRGRARNAWRKTEVDLVNMDWNAAAPQSWNGSNLVFFQHDGTSLATAPFALRWLRIEGTLYTKP